MWTSIGGCHRESTATWHAASSAEVVAKTSWGHMMTAICHATPGSLPQACVALCFMAVASPCRDLTEATLHGAGLSVLAAFIMVFLLIMVSWPPLASSTRDPSRSCQTCGGRHQLRMHLLVGSMCRAAPTILCCWVPS